MRLSEIESENERESEKESGSEIDPFRAWLFGDCLILVWGLWRYRTAVPNTLILYYLRQYTHEEGG